MPVELQRFLVRMTLLVDVQIDATNGKSAQQLVKRSIEDGGLENLNVRIRPLAGHPVGSARIVKTRVQTINDVK